jgi:hypothetical protein
VEPYLDLSLSRGDFLEVSCDKDELCATTSALHASPHKHIMHVASKNNELHLLSSLHTHAYDHDWCVEWSRRNPTRVSKPKRRHETNLVRVPKVEAQSNASPVRSRGAVRNKTDAQVAYEVRFGRSIYGWNHKFIELPMALV